MSIGASQHCILLTPNASSRVDVPIPSFVDTSHTTPSRLRRTSYRDACLSISMGSDVLSWPEFLLGEDGTMCCACPRLIRICPHPLYLQPQVALVLRSPLRPSTGRAGAIEDAISSLDRSFVLHTCFTVNAYPGPADNTDNSTDHGSNNSHFSLARQALWRWSPVDCAAFQPV